MNHAGKQIIVQKQPALDTETINAISAQLQQAPVEHPTPGLARWRAEPQSPAVFDDWAERFGVDAANVPNGLRLADFRLLAIDMDSTLVTMETLDEIADMAGLKAEVAAITEAAMRGEIKDFSESLTRRMALLKGVGEDLIERVYQERLHLSPGAEILLAAAKAAGLKTMLVSGGFTHFTERLKGRLGFDYAFANQCDMANQRLTGRVLGPGRAAVLPGHRLPAQSGHRHRRRRQRPGHDVRGRPVRGLPRQAGGAGESHLVSAQGRAGRGGGVVWRVMVGME